MHLSIGRYVNLAMLRPNALNPDIETQFLSDRDVSLDMQVYQRLNLLIKSKR